MVRTQIELAPFAPHAGWAPRAFRQGFTLIEVLVVTFLMALLVIAGLNTVNLLDRSTRRQALHTTAMELAQGRIEELHALAYNPPLAPFGAATTTQATNVTLALTTAGTTAAVVGVMTTTITPLGSGHLVTVSVSATNANQPLQVELQALFNKKSGNQP